MERKKNCPRKLRIRVELNYPAPEQNPLTKIQVRMKKKKEGRNKKKQHKNILATTNKT